MNDYPTSHPHLQPTRSDRGFARLPPVPGAYGGSARVFESSSAEEPSLWLAVTPPADAHRTLSTLPIRHSTELGGFADPAPPEATLHLRAPQALHLAEQLLLLLRQHYHGDMLRVLRDADVTWRNDLYDAVSLPGIDERE